MPPFPTTTVRGLSGLLSSESSAAQQCVDERSKSAVMLTTADRAAGVFGIRCILEAPLEWFATR